MVQEEKNIVKALSAWVLVLARGSEALVVEDLPQGGLGWSKNQGAV